MAGVEVQLKHGKIMSEFGRYRYNVILHLGPPPAAPLALLSVPGGDACSGARASATTLAAALAALAAASPRAVVACHGILNARLSADALLASGAEDTPAPAVEVGVGVAGGIDPAALRAALRAALPTHHMVLQWARDGTAEHMDAYALPSAEGGTDELIADEPTMLAAGLAAVMISACEIVGQAALVERAGNQAGLESFTNKLASVDDTASGGGDGGEALMHEARTLWADEAGGAQAKHAAVLALLGAVLGMPAPAPPSESFAINGGNSFVAMQAIGAVRAELGVGVPVFELLTKTFGAFADAVLAKAGGHDTLDARSWVVAVDESAPQQGRAAAQSASTFVFFPQAGASPKQYAAVFTELRKSVEQGRYLFVQPPGRDARADEPNETDVSRCIAETAAALKPHLVSAEARDGPTVFIGDSWGAIAAFATAHELLKSCGWAPSHMLVSGNASPYVTSAHFGLGSYSPTPMAQLTDKQLVDFLRASGVEDEDDERVAQLVAPFRADCQLYENYVRPEQLPSLPTKLCVLRGKEDKVVTLSEACGWVDEFDCEEARIVRVAGATHHVHEEKPGTVAAHILALASIVPLPEN